MYRIVGWLMNMKTMTEHLIITLRVGDRFYRLKIKRKDEKKYRDAVDVIEKKTNQYRDFFSGSETHELTEIDYMAMTTIQALSEHEELDAKNKLFESKLNALTLELEAYLKQVSK